MEGRWAKLTLHAHINKTIDLNKPIHPLAEALIFRHTEAMLELELAKLYPLYDDTNIYNIHVDWINNLKSCILHVDNSNTNKDQSSDLDSKIQAWKKLNKKQ